MSDSFADMCKFKLLDELLLILSNRKMVIKDLNKPKEHQTMLFCSNGVLDIHKKKESKNEYESLGKYDLLKSIAKLLSKPNEIFQVLEETVKSCKLVNFNESEFEHLMVCPLLTNEELSPLLKKCKKRVEIPRSVANSLNFLDNQIPWKESKEKIKENALVFDGDAPSGYIFRKNDGFLFFPYENLEQSPLMQFFDKIFDMENFDENTSKEENELRKKIMQDLLKDQN